MQVFNRESEAFLSKQDACDTKIHEVANNSESDNKCDNGDIELKESLKGDADSNKC